MVLPGGVQRDSCVRGGVRSGLVLPLRGGLPFHSLGYRRGHESTQTLWTKGNPQETGKPGSPIPLHPRLSPGLPTWVCMRKKTQQHHLSPVFWGLLSQQPSLRPDQSISRFHPSGPKPWAF